jgi:hypothetical protein
MLFPVMEERGTRRWYRFSWTNADIQSLGAVAAGDLLVNTLRPGLIVLRAALMITSQATGPATLTASLGRTGPNYNDWIVQRNLMVAPPAGYGLNLADLGTRMSDLLGDVPSLVNPTPFYMHLIATGGNLNTVQNCTGYAYLELAET